MAARTGRLREPPRLTYSLGDISAVTLPPPGDDPGSPIHDLIPGIDVRLGPATPGRLTASITVDGGGGADWQRAAQPCTAASTLPAAGIRRAVAVTG